MENDKENMSKPEYCMPDDEDCYYIKTYNDYSDEELAQATERLASELRKMTDKCSDDKETEYPKYYYIALKEYQYCQAVANGRKAGCRDVCDVPSSNLYQFYKDGSDRFGLMYSDGTVAVDNVCDGLCVIMKGVALYRAGGKWGAVSEYSGGVTEPQFDDIAIEDGEINASLNGKWGTIDRQGRFATYYDGPSLVNTELCLRIYNSNR